MLQRQERHWVTDMCAIQEATIISIIIIIIIKLLKRGEDLNQPGI